VNTSEEVFTEEAMMWEMQVKGNGHGQYLLLLPLLLATPTILAHRPCFGRARSTKCIARLDCLITVRIYLSSVDLF